MTQAQVSFSLPEVLKWTGGVLANERAVGQSVRELRVTALAPLADSKPEHLAFFFSKAYQHELPFARAGILIVGEGIAGPLEKSGLPLWRTSAVVSCADPYLAMAILSEKFAFQSTVSHVPRPSGPLSSEMEQPEAQIHPTAVVHPEAQLGRGVRVGAHSVIEAGARVGAGSVIYPGCFIGPDCLIGESTVLFPNVVLYERTEVGARVRLHAGVVLGADGFGYAPRFESGRIVEHLKIYHFGKTVIGDDVEIGAATTIDRGTISDTRVGRGAKIDNNVQIGHNCQIGEGAVLCGMSGMAGSSKVGKFVYMGAMSGTGNQVEVGDRSKIAGGTLIGKDLPADRTVIGYPHRDPSDFYKIHALLNRMLAKEKGRRRPGSS